MPHGHFSPVLRGAELSSRVPDVTRETLPDDALFECLSLARDTLVCHRAGTPAPQVLRPASNDPRSARLGVRIAFFHKRVLLADGFADQSSMLMNARLAAIRAVENMNIEKDVSPSIIAEVIFPGKKATDRLEAIVLLDSGRESLLMEKDKQEVRLFASDFLREGSNIHNRIIELLKKHFRLSLEKLNASDMRITVSPSLVGVLTPEDQPTRLYRNHPLRDTASISREVLTDSLRLAAQWLIQQKGKDGLFPRYVHIASGTERRDFRAPGQQIAAATALMHAANQLHTPEMKTIVQENIRATFAKTFRVHPQGEVGYLLDGAHIQLDDATDALEGIVSCGLAPSMFKESASLVEFIVTMQNDDGSFRKQFAPPKPDRQYPSSKTRLALMHYDGIQKKSSSSITTAITQGVNLETTHFWRAICAEDAAEQIPLLIALANTGKDHKALATAIKMGEAIVTQQQDRLSLKNALDLRGLFTPPQPMPKGYNLTETAHSCTALALLIQSGKLSEATESSFTHSLQEGLRALLQQQYRTPADLWICADATRVSGGFPHTTENESISLKGQTAAIEALVVALQTTCFAAEPSATADTLTTPTTQSAPRPTR